MDFQSALSYFTPANNFPYLSVSLSFTQTGHSCLPNEQAVSLNFLLSESQFCLGMRQACASGEANHFPSPRT